MEQIERKYQFSWELVGNIDEGRPNLGPMLRVELYRMMLYTVRDVVEQQLGSDATDKLFCDAGRLAGNAFYDKYLTETTDLNVFMSQLQTAMKEMKLGVLRVEQADEGLGELTLTVSEDLDCSGLPEVDYEVCHYDEGFIAALLERFSGKHFKVKEIDCWCTGDRTCRFTSQAEEEA